MHRTRREIRNASGQDVYIFKELVHNNQAQNELIEMGARATVSRIEDIPANSKVIVGPHSAPLSVLEAIDTRAALVDTSCRDVLKVREIAKLMSKDGYRIVFVGNKGHEEAEMIHKAIPDSFVVSSEDDIEKLPRDCPLGLVAQSTLTKERYMQLADAIKQTGRETRIGMTVCRETMLRQDSVRELVHRVDKMIVVGGTHSNNSRFLAETCQQFVPTWQIETELELQTSWFKNTDRIGITAGASTPDFMVNRVIKRIQEIANESQEITSKARPGMAASRARIVFARIITVLTDALLGVVELVKSVRSRRQNRYLQK